MKQNFQYECCRQVECPFVNVFFQHVGRWVIKILRNLFSWVGEQAQCVHQMGSLVDREKHVC